MYVARRRLTDKEATPREIRTTVVNEVEGFSIRRGAVDRGWLSLGCPCKEPERLSQSGQIGIERLDRRILFPSPYRQIRTRKISRRADCLLCMSGWRDSEKNPYRRYSRSRGGYPMVQEYLRRRLLPRITTPQSYRTESQPRNISAATSSERSADRVLSQAWNQTGMYQRRSFRGRRKCRSTRPPHLFEYG